MSKDNTILLFITRTDDFKIKEYRIAHTIAAGYIFEEPDEEDGFNNKHVIELFKDSKIFTDAYEAIGAACLLEEQIGYVEYGVRVYNFCHLWFPKTS